MNSLLRFQFLFFCVLVITQVSAQCGLTVDAGPDASFCPGGGLVQLNASISGPNLSNFSWSPTTGLDNPSSLTPRATVSAPIIYTLTAEVFNPADNLIVNGDFEAGASGFTTDYDPGSGGVFGLLSDEGEYAVSTNSSFTHTNFNSCNDHTGGGNMMVVNGSGTANDNIWCQTVTVDPNMTYSFNAWVQSVLSQNPAQLQFSVNGILLGDDFRASSTACAWNLFSETWNAGATTSAQICITNQNTGSSGNDFAIDDLFFGPICIQTDEVELTEAVVEAQTNSPVTFPCEPGPDGLELDASGSSEGAFYFYEWTTTNGNIVSGETTLFPTVDAAGEYLLTIRYDDGVTFCTDQALVEVLANNNIPTAVAALQNGVINCRGGMVVLSAAGSSTGPSITYEWVTTDGNIVSGGLSDQATVDQAGTYELVVTNSIEGCFDVTTVVVTGDTDPPVPEILEPLPFNCAVTSQSLYASNSATGDNYTLVWMTTDGNIINGVNEFDPLINAPGTYTLTITNEDNGCSASQAVTAIDASPDLVINLAEPPPIDCANTALRINATGTTSGSGIRYAWSTADGSISGNANGQMPLVDAPGTYVLLLSDLISGCTLRDSVTVPAGAGRPAIALQSPPLFTCDRAQITLNADGTTTGPDLVYTWTTTDGSIVSGGDSLAPVVTGPGTFTLSVRDIMTGCQRDTTFTIAGDLNAPLADAGNGFVLDCGKLTDTLDGTASAQGPSLSYDWTTTNGVIVADTSSPRLVIGSPGTYTLRVTDANNGCSDTSSVIIQRDINAPDFTIAPTTELTCINPRIALNATVTGNPPGLTYVWTTDDGNFTAPVNDATTTVDSAGTYLLTVTDPTNGCVTSQSVSVNQNIQPPAAEAGPPATITCLATTLRLAATDLGPGFSYQWTTINGDIEDNDDGINPLISAPATYYLFVTNDVTGCVNLDSTRVTANQTAPLVDLGPVPTITCDQSQLDLNGGNAAEPNLIYLWETSDGNLISSADTTVVTVNDDGSYTLTVTDTLNGCSAMDVVSVGFDTLAPVLTAGLPAELTCITNVVDLSSNITGAGASPLVGWSTTDGNLVGGQTGLTPQVDAPGTYLMVVENQATGCTDSLSVTVVEARDLPNAEAGNPLMLTCLMPEQTLSSAGSDQGTGFNFLWSTLDGNISSEPTDENPTVTAAGRYLLTVTNVSTGCTQMDSVEVTGDLVSPELDLATMGDVIDCTTSSRELTGSSPGETDITFAWSTVSGGTLSDVNGAVATATQAGLYRMRVTRNTDGCFSDTTVLVVENLTPPEVVITQPQAINCNFRERTISAETSIGYSYSWSTTDGRIIGNDDNATLDVDGAGTYQLVITDSANGCRDSATVIAQIDTLSPAAVIVPPGLLTCDDDVLTLDGSQSDEDLEFSWTWGTDDGNFVGLVTDLTPEVDQAGTYFIRVSNLTTGCFATDTVTVLADQVIPDINVGPKERMLTCIDTMTTLGADAGAMMGLTYQWAALEGNAPGSLNQPTTIVQTAGVYELLITNDATGCLAADTVTVFVNQAVPDAAIVPVNPLNCTVLERTLIAAPASPSQVVAYRWTTPDGNITGQNEGTEIIVNQAGNYQLFTLNLENGCTDSTTLLVEVDTLTPRINLPSAAPLTCRNPVIELNPDLSDTGMDFIVDWSTADGNIVSGSNTSRPSIDAAGTYVLTVINQGNNCTSTTGIRVRRNDTPPALSASVPAELNCRVLTSQINAVNATFGESFGITWSTSDGNLIDGGSTLRPTVDEPGTYNLTVIDETTDCRSTIAVLVTRDVTAPTVNLGPGFDLGCEVKPVLLDAGAGGTGPFTYDWITADGIILADQTLGQPTIQGGGTYIVEVTDQHNFCTASAEITLIQNLLLGFDAERATPTCLEPLGSILFTEVAGGTAPFLYSIDGASSFNPVALTDSLVPGRYDLVVQDANGCETAETLLIPNAPELDLFVDPRAVIELGDEYFINTRSNFADSTLTQISWTPALGLDCADCIRPTASPTETTTYTIRVVSSDGCTATDSVQLVVDDLLRIYFPTGFSPNGDGLNDVFLPLGDPAVISSIQEFTIFDRWGEAVHNATDFLPNEPANGWDGKLNDRPLNPAVFIYTATVAFVDGRVVTFKGDVVLMR